MDHLIRFIFRGKLSEARFFLSFDEKPFYIFCLISDEALVKEFGDEVNIKTDGSDCLASKNDWPELAELKETIFQAIRPLPHFQEMVSGNKAASDPMVGDAPFNF